MPTARRPVCLWEPTVQNGLLDLSDWNFVRDGVVELDGDWLEILLSDVSPLALKFRTVGTAYRLFVDGKKLLKVGRPGQSLAMASPDCQAKIVTFQPGSRRVEIII